MLKTIKFLLNAFKRVIILIITKSKKIFHKFVNEIMQKMSVYFMLTTIMMIRQNLNLLL